MQSTDDEPVKELQDGLVDPTAILVAVDTSAQALNVVAAATRLSRGAPSATVHIVHVYKSGRLDQARAGATVSNADLVDEAKDYLAFHVKTAKKQTRAPILGHFLVGDPV